VADSFHTKPLLRILQSADRYQILALNRHRARLFEGNRDALAEIELAPGVPRAITDVAVKDAESRERANRASAKGTGSDDPAAGRVATVLIDADQDLPGRVDPQTGAITRTAVAEPEGDDLLDDVGELVLRTGGEAVIVPAERMPTRTGLAAIYRY
jgi:hypothetical protein